MEGVNDPVDYNYRSKELVFLVVGDIDNSYGLLRQAIATLVQNAYIAGAIGTKGLGLNVPVKERAKDYAHLKGLIP